MTTTETFTAARILDPKCPHTAPTTLDETTGRQVTLGGSVEVTGTTYGNCHCGHGVVTEVILSNGEYFLVCSQDVI